MLPRPLLLHAAILLAAAIVPPAAGDPRAEPPGDAREDAAAPSPNVHVAYYLWYGTPASDEDWRHWNHKVLPHWEEGTRSRFPHGQPHQPPDDLHSPFFPARGPYSVRNTTVLGEHMEEIRNAGSRVAIASWWGRPDVDGTADTEGVNTDDLLPAVLDAAAAHGVEIAFHLEPYPGRTAALLSEDVAYLARRYGSHPALHRRGGLPVYYVYDSYHVSPADWAEVLCAGRPGSLRGGAADGVFFGLWLDHRHGEDLRRGCFDGFYTYFASEGFSFGSTPARWPEMVRFAHSHGMVAALSVGPGYNDERIRPWCGQPFFPPSPTHPRPLPWASPLALRRRNAANTKDRAEGGYYDRMWRHALAAAPDVVTVTSFNEWGEGTQIEPAAPRPGYEDYNPHTPDHYLRRTAHWAAALERSLRADAATRDRAHDEL